MNHTQNYNLNQWEASDKVQRTDFNADNAKIDAALAALATGKGNCRIAAGTYVGTGTYNTSHPTALDFAGTLGKAPELIIVRGISGGADALILLRGMESSFRTLSTSWAGSGMIYATWTDTGLSWYNDTNPDLQYNSKDTTYLYVAIG